ncbi:3-methyladenine DNA glycosylase 2 [Zoogloea oryzae]|uniref:DNA-3-methyladenine glycosylase II n=1 Tax=Zoogloea oryzae TaxID=310767 RepID=A0ABQ6FFC0_9RHOO|nr:3-methyladenine DNA glycosylase 2 [Zoogloea oryzae]GLT24310.1 3-methyladenine DNA glycosylase 2 [Zoogloea oryzae]
MQLPADFRPADFLAFHGRDARQVAERVTGSRIEKGILWHGHPARLTLDLSPGRAEARLDVDGPAPDPAEVTPLARHLLGLDQPVAELAAAHRDHPQLGPLLARLPGLRVPQAATPFEALSWAITGQQISLAAAVSIRRRLIETTNLHHSSGLACYPDAATLARLDEPTLRTAGYSATKAATLLEVARRTADGRLPLDHWLHTRTPAAEIHATLAQLRGIGPWTIDYTLLRGFAQMDGSLHGDVAVRRKLQALLGHDTPPTPKETQAWLAQFAPWRALVAAMLWAS